MHVCWIQNCQLRRNNNSELNVSFLALSKVNERFCKKYWYLLLKYGAAWFHALKLQNTSNQVSTCKLQHPFKKKTGNSSVSK